MMMTQRQKRSREEEEQEEKNTLIENMQIWNMRVFALISKRLNNQIVLKHSIFVKAPLNIG